MKKIPGSNWVIHGKNESRGGKAPESRRCDGEACISCEEEKEMKKVKKKAVIKKVQQKNSNKKIPLKKRKKKDQQK